MIWKQLVFGDCDTGMSFSAPKVVQLRDYITATKESSPLVFVVSSDVRFQSLCNGKTLRLTLIDQELLRRVIV